MGIAIGGKFLPVMAKTPTSHTFYSYWTLSYESLFPRVHLRIKNRGPLCLFVHLLVGIKCYAYGKLLILELLD